MNEIIKNELHEVNDAVSKKEQKSQKKSKKLKKNSKKQKDDIYEPSQQLDNLHSNNEGQGSKLDKKFYEKELARLQVELVKMQYWVKHVGLRVIIIFEDEMRQAKEEQSSESLNRLTLEDVVSLPWERLQIYRKLNGISSVM